MTTIKHQNSRTNSSLLCTRLCKLVKQHICTESKIKEMGIKTEAFAIDIRTVAFEMRVGRVMEK